MRRAGIDRSRLHRRIPGPLPGADLDGSRTRAGSPQGIARTDDCRARAPPVCARSGRALKVGGGLRVGVGVERLRVAASVGALFGIEIILCVAIVRTLAGVVGMLYPIPRGQAPVESPITNNYNHICTFFPAGSRLVRRSFSSKLLTLVRYPTPVASIHYQIGAPLVQRRLLPHDFLSCAGPNL